MANRPRSLVGRNAGVGLDAGSGGTLDIDLYELTAKTNDPVGADSAAIVDSENSNVTRLSTFTKIAAMLAGSNATSALKTAVGVLQVWIHGVTEKTAPIAADEILVGDSEETPAFTPKRSTITNLLKIIGTTIAGTNATSGLSAAASGVLRVNVGSTTAKSAPVLADAVLANDSADGTNKSILISKLLGIVGTNLKLKLADGTDVAANVTISGMAVGDILVSVFAMTAKASIATMVDRTAEYAIGSGVLTKAAGTDERLNQLIIMYLDLT
jgi:hypothetical protein